MPKNLFTRIGTLLLLALSLLSVSCTKDNSTISRRYPCRFHFYVQMHPTSMLLSAYKSPGTYVFTYSKVELDREKGVSYRYVNVLTNNPDTPEERNRIETQIENNVPYMMGASNEVGLIVGRTNFSGPVAYDRACPTCTGIYPLTWNGKKPQVVCNSCKRVYDLETGAIVEGAEGEPLMRYLVSMDDVKLTVQN